MIQSFREEQMAAPSSRLITPTMGLALIHGFGIATLGTQCVLVQKHTCLTARVIWLALAVGVEEKWESNRTPSPKILAACEFTVMSFAAVLVLPSTISSWALTAN